MDGFCGPGKYQGGELGSPLVALQAIMRHRVFDAFASDGKGVEFLFVDKEPSFTCHLSNRLAGSRWPNAFSIEVQNRLFADVMEGLINDVEETGREVHFSQLLEDEINWHRQWLESDLHGALELLEYGEVPGIVSVRREDGKNRRKRSYKGCLIKFGMSPMQNRLF